MSEAVETFLKTLTIPHDDVTILQEVSSICSTPNSIFEYIKRDYNPLTPGKYHGESASGQSIQVAFTIPKEFHSPPDVNPNSFEYSRTSFGLKYSLSGVEYEYNYLPTFNVSTFPTVPALNLADSGNVVLNLIKELLSSSQNQSRVAGIWKQTAAMVALLRAYRDKNHVLLRYFHLLVGSYVAPPFYEKEGKIVWEKTRQPVLSVLPLLLHGAGHLAIMHFTNVVTEVDCIMCIQHWMDCLPGGFQDRKLKTKSHLSNWLPYSLHRLPPQKIAMWSQTGCLMGTTTRDTTEPDIVMQEEAGRNHAAKLNLSSEVERYVRHLQSASSLDSCIAGYLVGRVMSNDGTYFASLPEITIDKAVLPRVEHHVIRTMRPRSHLTNSQVLYYDQTSVPEFLPGYNYLRRAFPQWRANSAVLLSNLNYEIIPFLTTSSAGQLPEGGQRVQHADKRLRAASKKRVIAFIDEREDYLNLERFQARLVDVVVAVERTQILRRARAVAGVNNPRILASLPVLRALEELQHLLPQASSGKQKGDMSDMLPLLYYTSSANVLCSSMDVSGFDASVQLVSQMQTLSMTSEALADVPCHKYLCYRAHQHTDPITQETSIVSAFSYLISDIMTRFQPQSTRVKGKVIPYVTTADPTFPSGLGYTTAHHTIRLISAIFGDVFRDLRFGILSSIRHTAVQGDDISMAFRGSPQKRARDLKRVQDSIEKVGFKTENESSVSTMEFLQQRAVLGRPVLYPDRVSLLTAEKPREAKGPVEKMSELLALAYDLGNRVPNPHMLLPILYALYLFCAAKVTLKISTGAARKLYEDKEFIERIFGRGIIEQDPKECTHDTFFFSFIAPLSYAWVEGGPMLPPPSYRRKDGTYSPVPNFYSLRGAYAKTFLFHLSLTSNMWKELMRRDEEGAIIDASLLLDYELLDDRNVLMGVHLAETLSKFKTVSDVDIEREYRTALPQMAAALHAYQNLRANQRSLDAAAKLHAAGVTLPSAIIKGLEAETKIKGTLRSVASSPFEEIVRADKLALMLLESFRSYKKNRRLRVHPEDYSCLYYCEWEEGQLITPSTAYEVIYENGVTLSPDANKGSIASVLMAYLGTRSGFQPHGDPFMQKVQRAFKDFVRGDEVLEAGLKVLRHAPELIREFSTAVGLSKAQENRLIALAPTYAGSKYTYHRIIYSPRQYFMVNSDPYALRSHISCQHQGGPLLIALSCVQAQEWLSYNVPTSKGERIKVYLPWRTLERLGRLKQAC
ncbi:S2 gene product [Spissistilus festinus reovirus]|uniref:RNA directed RNA polymerase n=1 Tax=Spissistilus festinus reovirus TaxID=1004049 RepID=UPI00024D946D|nr:S2 gene product [Spissistilus festinus reovirus]AEC32488.1 RNA directed RNA polymerase [Spissistilus festinus reovirus]